MSTTKPLLAFFGATGGSTLSAIVPALQAGYDCTALCRTPSKLTTMLREKSVPQSAIDAHLHITTGNVLQVPDVKSNLTLNGRPADIIISGIGITSFAELRQPTNLCETAVRNIISALSELKPAKKPLLIALSSTGITQGQTPRDLPLLMVPMYALLKHPHADKIRMEKAVEEYVASSGEECTIGGYVFVRPSLLMDGKSKGSQKVRVGVESQPAVGYTINRNDVGLWLFENLVEGEGAEKYINRKPSITY